MKLHVKDGSGRANRFFFKYNCNIQRGLKEREVRSHPFPRAAPYSVPGRRPLLDRPGNDESKAGAPERVFFGDYLEKRRMEPPSPPEQDAEGFRISKMILFLHTMR